MKILYLINGQLSNMCYKSYYVKRLVLYLLVVALSSIAREMIPDTSHKVSYFFIVFVLPFVFVFVFILYLLVIEEFWWAGEMIPDTFHYKSFFLCVFVFEIVFVFVFILYLLYWWAGEMIPDTSHKVASPALWGELLLHTGIKTRYAPFFHPPLNLHFGNYCTGVYLF